MIYALVRDGEILRRMDFSVTPPELPAAKGMKWYPLVDTPRPEYNSKTHGLRESPPLLDDACTLQWEVFPLPAEEVAAIAAQARAKKRAKAKANRAEAVEAITVTTKAGNTFDGDETSQNRMARAVIVLNATGIASVPWTLANNAIIDASAAELTEALALAGAAQSALWRITP